MIELQDSSFDDFELNPFHLHDIWDKETKEISDGKSDLSIERQFEFLHCFEDLVQSLSSSLLFHRAITYNKSEVSRQTINEKILEINSLMGDLSIDNVPVFQVRRTDLLHFLLVYEFRLADKQPSSLKSIFPLLHQHFPYLEKFREVGKQPALLEEQFFQGNLTSIFDGIFNDFSEVLPPTAKFLLENYEESFNIRSNPFEIDLSFIKKTTLEKRHLDLMIEVDNWLLKKECITENYDWIEFSSKHNKQTRVNVVGGLIDYLISSRSFKVFDRMSLTELAKFFAKRYRLCLEEEKSLKLALKTQKIKLNPHALLYEGSQPTYLFDSMLTDIKVRR